MEINAHLLSAGFKLYPITRKCQVSKAHLKVWGALAGYNYLALHRMEFYRL